MNLTAYEKESIINWNQGEQTASVYTHDKALMKQLNQLAAQRPEQVQIERTSHGGQAADYIIPKTWVKIRPPRIASEAQKAAARAALQKARV